MLIKWCQIKTYEDISYATNIELYDTSFKLIQQHRTLKTFNQITTDRTLSNDDRYYQKELSNNYYLSNQFHFLS